MGFFNWWPFLEEKSGQKQEGLDGPELLIFNLKELLC